MKNTAVTFKQAKEKNEKLTMLTAYDYSTAKIIDEAGINGILVGDSLGMVCLGYEDTLSVTMEDMIHHTSAVTRGAKNTLVVADMPFMSYQTCVYDAVVNAGRLIKEGRAHVVKLEGGIEVCDKIEAIVKASIPVMAHIGLTPQSVNAFGGFKVQGKDKEAARNLIEAALAVEKAGAFAVVLECVPAKLAAIITEKLSIPTIGIGAGAQCDGQILVYQDMLGMYSDFTPKFVKKYENLGEKMNMAFKKYIEEVKDGVFPAEEHSFKINDEVIEKYERMSDWLAGLYVNTLNLIQYMHDKYYYEAAEMALIDTDVKRTFATGIAGFSHVVDSLSAIKYAKVKTVRDEEKGIVVDYQIEGDFPKYGNDDDKADDIAVWLLRTFLEKIKKRHTYRNSEPTTSILTITSNVVYGKYTGTMPDGRKAGTPLSPGANPSYGAEQNGLLASLNSLTKLPYEWALDGISNTQTMNPDALGHNEEERVANLVNVMDGYFDQGAHHLNVNVFGKDKLLDAMEHPEKPEYANFTIRVSGYAVKFIDLTKEQQMDVISRTFHDRM